MVSSVKRGPSSYRFPSSRTGIKKTSYGKSKTRTFRASRTMTPRRSVAQAVRRAVMGMSELKEINAISAYVPINHDDIPAVAVSGTGKDRDGNVRIAVAGQDTRNLTYCTMGSNNNQRDGNTVYGMDLDTNIHFNIPDLATGELDMTKIHPDNALFRVIFYEADHNTFKQMTNNVEKNLLTPIGLASDANPVLTFLNRKDFRILSDELVDVRHTGAGSYGTPTHYVYNKKIPIRKNLTYVDAYTPNKQMGVVVVGHGGLHAASKIGDYRISWKFTFKDL